MSVDLAQLDLTKSREPIEQRHRPLLEIRDRARPVGAGLAHGPLQRDQVLATVFGHAQHREDGHRHQPPFRPHLQVEAVAEEDRVALPIAATPFLFPGDSAYIPDGLLRGTAPSNRAFCCGRKQPEDQSRRGHIE